MRPLLVRTISSLGGTEGEDGCEDCSLTVGCSLADSLLIGMSGIMSNSSPEVVGDTISWRRFRLSVPCDVCTVYDLGATSDKLFQHICYQVSTPCLLALVEASCGPYVNCQSSLSVLTPGCFLHLNLRVVRYFGFQFMFHSWQVAS